MSAPILDIVIPTYNRVDYLKECLLSVLAQSFVNFRIIVLDNASEQDVASMVSSINDDRVSLISNSENIGGPANILKAFEMASSDFVMVFHDDDFMHPRLLEAQIEIFNLNEDIVFVAPSVNLISDHSRMSVFPQVQGNSSYVHQMFSSQTDFMDAHFSGRYVFGFGGVMYRTEAIKKEKLNIERFGNISDRPYLVSLAALGKCAFLVYPNYNVRTHQGQDSFSGSWGYHHEVEVAKFYLDISRSSKNNPYFSRIAKMLAQFYAVRRPRPPVTVWLKELDDSGLLHWTLLARFLPYYVLRNSVVRFLRSIAPALMGRYTQMRVSRGNYVTANSVQEFLSRSSNVDFISINKKLNDH